MRFVVILLCLDFCATSSKGPTWDYEDETKWPGDICKSGGTRQSPIDIQTEDVIHDLNMVFIKNGSLNLVGYETVLMTAINNGLTVQFSTEGDTEMHPTMSGGPLEHTYRLEQLHFHWLSEHAINGIKYPMELHLVHVRSDLSVSDALKQTDGLAIISIFCNVQADELIKDPLDATEDIMKHIPALLNIGDRVSGVVMDVT